MQDGDLGNEPVPRYALVFEHLVGLLPSDWLDRVSCEAFIRTKRWKHAVDHLKVNEPLAKQMWHITWHLNYQLDVLTYWDPKAVGPIEAWLDRENLPVARVWYTDPVKLARQVAVMPDLAVIFDPDPKHQLTYGRKGRIVNPAAPDILKAW